MKVSKGVAFVFGISKNTLYQLIKEFRIPFLVAALWTIYAAWGPELSAQSVISSFGSSFFLASWLTGQFFRVRKQAGVEESLGNVEQRISHLVEDLETRTQKMTNYITGGDSYLHFLAVPFADKILWVASHKGQYPLQQPTIRIVDVEHLKGNFRPDDLRNCTTTHHLGDFHCGMTQKIAESQIGNRNRCSFEIFTLGRNGKYLQETRLVRVEGTLRTALRITGPSGIVHEDVHRDFPVDADGRVAWDRPHAEIHEEFPPYQPSSSLP